MPAPEAEPSPRRRRFTAAYKAAIVAECDAASQPGEIGAILRREGLYSSHLVDWRRRRAEGGLSGLGPKKTPRCGEHALLRAPRTRALVPRDVEAKEVARDVLDAGGLGGSDHDEGVTAEWTRGVFGRERPS